MSSMYIFLWTSLRLAIRQLLRNKVRSFLTMLGLFIGVGGVVAIVSLGEGLRIVFASLMADVAVDDLIYIMPDVPMEPGRITYAAKPFKNRDLDMIKTSEYVVAAMGMDVVNSATIKYGWRSETAFCGIAPNTYFPMDGWKLERGRYYTYAEDRGRALVCVVGSDVGEKILPEGMDILGANIMINNQRFRVVGVLQSRSALEGGEQSNTMVFVPLNTGQDRITGRDDLYWMVAKVRNSKELDRAKEDISSRLRASRRIRSGADDDFTLSTADDWAKFGNDFVNTLIKVFGVVAVIALLVGGIGVMNIMLVSVRERTREIGLRKALGATAGMITWQFLIEAITLTILGGIGGLIFGYGLGAGVALVLKGMLSVSWTPAVPLTWIVAVLCTSIGLGITFGVYPAWRAGKLDPIIALHYE